MNRLKELRIEKDLSQAKLAELFNISQQAVSHYEKGIRDIDSSLIKTLSNFFSVSSDYLLGISDIRNYTDDPNVTISLHSDTDYDDLPDEARKEINNFIEYVKQKYKDKK
ncbi:helix-turn-helix transcriptional regulator [Clostridium botulinum]|uniref:helix-turn-helix domain-containing protein n=1 Tax=Clostridium botulinum TaxID=1491 RepID=UPI00030FC911|nr:helix-turn-helix transcriptional regulator [Clostridium botulinum]MBY6816501.1 helix-turn-helix transcriptional regulator [Clostridium botulinum]MBY6827244.1 helix-turn-helix transcriptional regulator [Clostridium botulinum]MBY6859192.1 helix-turn-helix transcriptional regulator [Clostridium botulinum]MBY7041524.1 helix-turn-helix transcriptional regulator [Clostridium botulinum]MCR1158718.1 helix-turn-helix transcriptional regulator [Clostridium botulinum]